MDHEELSAGFQDCEVKEIAGEVRSYIRRGTKVYKALLIVNDKTGRE